MMGSRWNKGTSPWCFLGALGGGRYSKQGKWDKGILRCFA